MDRANVLPRFGLSIRDLDIQSQWVADALREPRADLIKRQSQENTDAVQTASVQDKRRYSPLEIRNGMRLLSNRGGRLPCLVEPAGQ